MRAMAGRVTAVPGRAVAAAGGVAAMGDGVAAVAGGVAAVAGEVAAVAGGVAAVAGRVAAVAGRLATVAGGGGAVADGVTAVALMWPCDCVAVPEAVPDAVPEAVPAEETSGGPLDSTAGGAEVPLGRAIDAAGPWPTGVRRGWLGAGGSGFPTPAAIEAENAGTVAGGGSTLPMPGVA